MHIKHLLISSLFVLLIFFNTTTSSAQTTYSAELELKAQGATQKELPFWLHSNQRGRISPESNVVGLATARMQHQLRGESILEIGAGTLVHDGFQKRLALDEAYLHFQNGHFYVTGGIKQKEELYNGLSATNENILWSLNARPLPGIEIGTVAPFFIFPGVGIEARLGEYILEEERHVPWARVHHKKFNVVLQPTEDWEIKAGIQHYAQWGGTSPERGQQPQGLVDYLRIISGRNGGENAAETDKLNALGNHLGSWEFEVTRSLHLSSFTFLFNNIFEDGSGSRFANFPDGRYTFLWQSSEDEFLRAFIYEFYYTKNQSVNTRIGNDFYLYNTTYRSGWTFHNRIIAAPFFSYDPEQNIIDNNKFIVHHLGLAGNWGNFYYPLPFKVLVSYRHNEGTYGFDRIPADQEPKIVSTYFTTRLYNGDFDYDIPRLKLDFLFAADFHNLLDPNFGAGVSLIYSLAN